MMADNGQVDMGIVQLQSRFRRGFQFLPKPLIISDDKTQITNLRSINARITTSVMMPLPVVNHSLLAPNAVPTQDFWEVDHTG